MAVPLLFLWNPHEVWVIIVMDILDEPASCANGM